MKNQLTALRKLMRLKKQTSVSLRAPGVNHKRRERTRMGVSARQQRRRRIEARFPAEYGTKRGLRRMRQLLRAACVSNCTSRAAKGCACIEFLPRDDRRWLERWWTAEEKTA